MSLCHHCPAALDCSVLPPTPLACRCPRHVPPALPRAVLPQHCPRHVPPALSQPSPGRVPPSVPWLSPSAAPAVPRPHSLSARGLSTGERREKRNTEGAPLCCRDRDWKKHPNNLQTPALFGSYLSCFSFSPFSLCYVCNTFSGGQRCVPCREECPDCPPLPRWLPAAGPRRWWPVAGAQSSASLPGPPSAWHGSRPGSDGPPTAPRGGDTAPAHRKQCSCICAEHHGADLPKNCLFVHISTTGLVVIHISPLIRSKQGHRNAGTETREEAGIWSCK